MASPRPNTPKSKEPASPLLASKQLQVNVRSGSYQERCNHTSTKQGDLPVAERLIVKLDPSGVVDESTSVVKVNKARRDSVPVAIIIEPTHQVNKILSMTSFMVKRNEAHQQ